MAQNESNWDIWKDVRTVLVSDIGDPVRTIHSFAGFLLEDYASSFDEDGRTCVEGIISASERVQKCLRSLDFFLDIKIFSPQLETFNIEGVVKCVSEEFTSRFTNITVRLPDTFPIIEADKRELEEVFRQLMHNAVLHNDKDKKSIEVSWHKRMGVHEFVVTGNGKGILEAYQGRVFFFPDSGSRYQGDKPGQGISADLALCRAMVQAHGGDIWADSTEGVGPSFHFTIPGKVGQVDER